MNGKEGKPDKSVMGYAKDDAGNAVLTMTRQDYEKLLLAMGYFIGAWTKDNPDELIPLLEWVNRTNAGNPNFQPYKAKP